jgi:hypothetical protein
MGIWWILRATGAIRAPVPATSSTTFNPDVGRSSGWSSRRLWYSLRVHRSRLADSTLSSRLAETKNRPSGFDYIRLILALGVIWSHSRLLTDDWQILPLFSFIMGLFVVLLLPMFFSLSLSR